MLTCARNAGVKASRPLSVAKPAQLVLNGAAMDAAVFRATLQRPSNSIVPEAWHQTGVRAQLPAKIKVSNRPQDLSSLLSSPFSSRLERRELLAATQPIFSAVRKL